MRILPGKWEWRYGHRQNKHRNLDKDGGGYNPGYWYDSYPGEYRDKFGNIVSYDEVHYNYIIPNSEFTIYLSDILSESIITDPSVLPQSKEDYQKQANEYNNNTTLVGTNDKKLKEMFNKIFNMSLGNFDLRILTTNSGRYGMTSNLQYYNINNNTFVAGYTLPEEGGWGIHISPFALSNDVYFKAYGGHELIHLYHYYKTSFGEKYSEQTAYLYTYNVFITNNYNGAANSAMNVAKSRGWWIKNPVKQRKQESDHAYIWVMGH